LCWGSASSFGSYGSDHGVFERCPRKRWSEKTLGCHNQQSVHWNAVQTIATLSLKPSSEFAPITPQTQRLAKLMLGSCYWLCLSLGRSIHDLLQGDFWTPSKPHPRIGPLFDQVNSRRAESAQTPVGTPTCRDKNILFFEKGGSRVRYHGARVRASCNFLLANAAG
jgi:hypothetical protein